MPLTLRSQHEFSHKKPVFRMGGQQRSRFLGPTRALHPKTRASLTGFGMTSLIGVQHGLA